MSEYDTGLVFEAEGMKADEDGYVYFDFKTDFYWPGWWYADDDGVKHTRGDGNGKFQICQKYLPKLNGIQILLSQAQSGDVISIGDVVRVKIIDIDYDKKRISLSMRALLPPPEKRAKEEKVDEAPLTMSLDEMIAKANEAEAAAAAEEAPAAEAIPAVEEAPVEEAPAEDAAPADAE